MARLPETEAVLAELSSTRGMFAGQHYGEEPVVGASGLQIGTVPFDPTQHDPMRIDPFSIMELVTNEPQVPLVIPHKPLQVRVITESRTTRDDPRMVALKRNLVGEIQESLDESLPGIGDLTYVYHVGQKDSKQARYDVDAVETDGTPEANALAIAELCRDSLAFVISDFGRLPLDQHGPSNYPSTIAIKTNHNSELGLPANVGTVPVSEYGEVNTNKPKELAKYNEGANKANALIVARLQRVGIKVAQIVFDPTKKIVHGLDITSADRAIAQAISAFAER